MVSSGVENQIKFLTGMIYKACHGLALSTRQSHSLPRLPLVHDVPATLASIHPCACRLTPLHPSSCFCLGEGVQFWETEFRPSRPLPFPSRKLSHPKLVQLYGVCLEQAPICLVFEFMEHGCLSDYLRSQRGLFAAETLLGMCLDVCEGMAYLEEACVIHRDLVRGSRADICRSGMKGCGPLKCGVPRLGIHYK